MLHVILCQLWMAQRKEVANKTAKSEPLIWAWVTNFETYRFKEQSCCLESTPLWPQRHWLDYTAQLPLLIHKKIMTCNCNHRYIIERKRYKLAKDTWNVGNRYISKQQTARTHEMLETAIISILSYIIIIILTNQTANLKNTNSFYDFAS